MLKFRKLELKDMPPIAKKLVAQAKLVKDKKLLRADWPMENLQTELEGVSYSMINIKKEMKSAGMFTLLELF